MIASSCPQRNESNPNLFNASYTSCGVPVRKQNISGGQRKGTGEETGEEDRVKGEGKETRAAPVPLPILS